MINTNVFFDLTDSQARGGSGHPGGNPVGSSKNRQEIILNMRRASLTRSYLCTNVHYMQQFHLINLNTTVLGYNLANLEVAIGWFILKRTRITGPLWSKKKKRHASTSTLGQVRKTSVYCTCWWYSLCNFQYRQHYENTCSYNVEC